MPESSSNVAAATAAEVPTREQFLESGLVAVTDLAATNQSECAFCFNPPRDPVRLPCPDSHVCCRRCITRWLTRQNRNNCPKCGHEFFPALPLDGLYVPNLYESFPDILEMSRGNHQTFDEDHDLLGDWMVSLRDHPRTTEVQVVHLPNRNAEGAPLEETLIVGDGYIDQHRLADGLAMVAAHTSIYTHESFERWESYDQVDGGFWEEILHTVFTACIVPYHETTVGVVQMPSIWLERVRAELASGSGWPMFRHYLPEVDPTGRVGWEGMRRDLRVVLEYLAFLAWDEQRSRVQRSRSQPRLQRTLSRVGESIRRRLGRPQ